MECETVRESPAPYGAQTAAAESCARVVLHNIRWQTFELLAKEIGENRGVRLAFDNGLLEIMAPYYLHENTSYFVSKLVDMLAEEFDYNIQPAGAMLCKREDLNKGLQPDSSYYIQNADRVRPKRHIDLSVDPPPDLMIEVDIGNSSMAKQQICAALGVPEIWRYSGAGLEISILKNGGYVTVIESSTLPGVMISELPTFIELGISEGQKPMLKSFRKWLRTTRRQS